MTAWHLANIILKINAVATANGLPRDFHLIDESLTQLILSFVPQQVPFGLRINLLPREIISWLINLLQNQPIKEQRLKQQTQSRLSHGTNSLPTSNPLEFQTHTLLPSPETTNIEFLERLFKQSEKVNFILNKTTLVNLNQLEPPWIMWHRCTDWPIIDLTPDWTPMASLHSFYSIS